MDKLTIKTDTTVLTFNTQSLLVSLVDSVNGKTGIVTLNAQDVGADLVGAATAVQQNLDDAVDLFDQQLDSLENGLSVLSSEVDAKANASAVVQALSTKADLVDGVVPTSQLPIASKEALGAVKAGDYLSMQDDGKLNLAFYTEKFANIISNNAGSELTVDRVNVTPYIPVYQGDYSRIILNGELKYGYTFSVKVIAGTQVQVSIPVGQFQYPLLNIFSSLTSVAGETEVPFPSLITNVYEYAGVAVEDRFINIHIDFQETYVSFTSNIDNLTIVTDRTGFPDELWLSFCFTLNNGDLNPDIEDLPASYIRNVNNNYPLSITNERVSNLPYEIQYPLTFLEDRTNSLTQDIANISFLVDQKADAASVIQTLGAKADLENGVIPASQLPSYVDDVLVYPTWADFPLTGEAGKIYVTEDTNKTYRWAGSSYVVIADSIALGETAATAYRGDRGKAAYDHSISQGNPHNTTTSDIPEGARLYFTDQRVRYTILGSELYINPVNNFPITVADGIIDAFGKVQSQINVINTNFQANVRATKLTGLFPFNDTPIVGTDDILGGFSKAQSQITGIKTALSTNVRSTLLTGLSTVTATSVTAIDTVLQGIGKLQGQLGEWTVLTRDVDYTAHSNITSMDLYARVTGGMVYIYFVINAAIIPSDSIFMTLTNPKYLPTPLTGVTAGYPFRSWNCGGKTTSNAGTRITFEILTNAPDYLPIRFRVVGNVSTVVQMVTTPVCIGAI